MRSAPALTAFAVLRQEWGCPGQSINQFFPLGFVFGEFSAGGGELWIAVLRLAAYPRRKFPHFLPFHHTPMFPVPVVSTLHAQDQHFSVDMLAAKVR